MEETITFEAIGTKWEISVHDSDLAKKIEIPVKVRIEQFENTYSRFRNNSFVNRISSQKEEVTLPDDAKELFDVYYELEKLTQGAFTPFIGKTLSEAGYDKNYSFVSNDTFTPLVRWDEALDYKFPKLKIKTPVELDFGAAGKGYIMDIVASLIKNLGVTNYIIDAGHDILCLSPNKSIRVGLEHPVDLSRVVGFLEIAEGSVCGSAGNRRSWGKYNHLINGKTLKVTKDILSTWVVSDSALIADALATSLFFVNPETLGEKFNFEYLVLYSDFSINKSKNLPGELFR